MVESTITIGMSLPLKGEGEMDVHHLDLGRGNCALIIAPDNTTIMIDAGASLTSYDTSSRARPNESLRPGQWMARYVTRYTLKQCVDYMVVTHYHPDHTGDINDTMPLSQDGKYRLSGVCDVDAMTPIGCVIDRGFPNYGNQPPPKAPWGENYLQFLRSRADNKKDVQRAEVGSDKQIHLRYEPTSYPAFNTQILAANGVVWGGEGQPLQHILPDPLPKPLINENLYCIAMRVNYGAFSYFAGGDLLNHTCDGAYPYLDIETPVARAAGRTEVSSANHHGYFDACGPEFTKNLDSQVYVIQSWDVGHPGTSQIERLLGAWPEKEMRHVFATDILPANSLTNRRWVNRLKSAHGHIVVRVAKGGDSYMVYVTDSNDEEGKITGVFGPYYCRKS